MIVAGPKTAQLTPMSVGPRFLSPEESTIAALWSIETNKMNTVKPGKPSVQSSLATSRCLYAPRRGGDGKWGGEAEQDGDELWDSRLVRNPVPASLPRRARYS